MTIALLTASWLLAGFLGAYLASRFIAYEDDDVNVLQLLVCMACGYFTLVIISVGCLNTTEFFSKTVFKGKRK